MDWVAEILKDEAIEDKLEAIKKAAPKWVVPKDKYNEQAEKLREKESELSVAKKQLEDVEGKVADLEKLKGDKTALETSVNQLKTAMEDYKKDAETQILNIKKKQAVERGLRDAFANPDSIDLLVDKFALAEIELTDDGKVKDWEKHLAPVKEARKTLFGEEHLSGGKPPHGDSTEGHGYRERYEAAIKAGQTVEAIKIKQEAFSKGEMF